jgi:hypothetical protein
LSNLYQNQDLAYIYIELIGQKYATSLKSSEPTLQISNLNEFLSFTLIIIFSKKKKSHHNHFHTHTYIIVKILFCFVFIYQSESLYMYPTAHSLVKVGFLRVKCSLVSEGNPTLLLYKAACKIICMLEWSIVFCMGMLHLPHSLQFFLSLHFQFKKTKIKGMWDLRRFEGFLFNFVSPGHAFPQLSWTSLPCLTCVCVCVYRSLYICIVIHI